MVTLDETVIVYKQLPNPQFGVLPNTPHPIEQEILTKTIAATTNNVLNRVTSRTSE
jgi:hypothetical protein